MSKARPPRRADASSGASPFAIRDRLTLLLGHIFLTLLWPAFNGTYTVKAAAGGFLFATVILTLYQRAYGRWLVRAVLFILYLFWTIAVSCAQVLLQILAHKTYEQAIVAYEVTADSDMEVLVLATVITLTPGTISVDTRDARNGGRTLYVHLLDGRRPEQFRAQLKYGFERRILELARE